MSRGRQPGFQMGAEHRTKISNSKILKRLIAHVEGTEEMSATQVTAALGLLKKVMPDLSSQQLSGDPENPLTNRHEIIIQMIESPDVGDTN